MIHPDTEMRFVSPEIGHGVFASRRIPRGTFIWFLSRLDRVLPYEEARSLPRPYLDHLRDRAAVQADGSAILCWDHARFMNHSCDPSIYSAGSLEIAVRDIEAGEEITCEYAVMNSIEPLPCLCGAPACRGLIHTEDVHRLGHLWDEAARQALRFAARVPQPLLVFHEDPALVKALVEDPSRIPPHSSQYCPPERRPF